MEAPKFLNGHAFVSPYFLGVGIGRGGVYCSNYLSSLSLYRSLPLSLSLSIYIYVTLSICISSFIYIHIYIYIHMAPTQEHPAKYFSAHICPRPFWKPVKFQPYFKNSHHRQPQQIRIHITVRPKRSAYLHVFFMYVYIYICMLWSQ